MINQLTYWITRVNPTIAYLKEKKTKQKGKKKLIIKIRVAEKKKSIPNESYLS